MIENSESIRERGILPTGLPEKWERILKWEPTPLYRNPKLAEIDWGRSRFRSRKITKNTRGKSYPNSWRQFQRQKYIFFSVPSDWHEKKKKSSKKIYFFSPSKTASTPIYLCNFRVRTLGDWFSFQNPFSFFWQPCSIRNGPSWMGLHFGSPERCGCRHGENLVAIQ